MKPVTLSIIILNYNTKNFVLNSIRSIEKNYPKETQSGEYELIVADNGSSDNSIGAFEEFKKHSRIKFLIFIDNKKNIGFSKGNNQAIALVHGRCILILNPDTIVPANTLSYMIDFIDEHPGAGAATCKIITPNDSLDPNCLRGFPTPWNALCHFSGLAKLLPQSRFFSGYLQSGWRDMGKTQEVDAIEGSFMLITKKVGEEIGWFDEDYFFYGEDLQLCFDIRKAGYKIYYVPHVTITHYGGVSSGIKKQSQKITTANLETKIKAQKYRFEAMRIFYKKNYSPQYPKILNWMIYKIIHFLYKKNLRQSIL